MILRRPAGHLHQYISDIQDHPQYVPMAGGDCSSLFVDAMRQGLPPRLEVWFDILPHGTAWHQFLTFTGPEGLSITWNQFLDKGICHIEYVEVDESHRSHGIGTQLMRNALSWYDHMGVVEVRLHAAHEDGGFFWATFGFIPDQASWAALGRRCDDLAQRPRLSDLIYLQPLWQGNPENIYLLATSAFGREILHRASWYGTLDLTDPLRYTLARERAES